MTMAICDEALRVELNGSACKGLACHGCGAVPQGLSPLDSIRKEYSALLSICQAAFPNNLRHYNAEDRAHCA